MRVQQCVHYARSLSIIVSVPGNISPSQGLGGTREYITKSRRDKGIYHQVKEGQGITKSRRDKETYHQVKEVQGKYTTKSRRDKETYHQVKEGQGNISPSQGGTRKHITKSRRDKGSPSQGGTRKHITKSRRYKGNTPPSQGGTREIYLPMLYWHIENIASLLTNLFVKITISFLQCKSSNSKRTYQDKRQNMITINIWKGINQLS